MIAREGESLGTRLGHWHKHCSRASRLTALPSTVIKKVMVLTFVDEEWCSHVHHEEHCWLCSHLQGYSSTDIHLYSVECVH